MARAAEVTLELIDRQIAALGEGTVEYHEALAFYCLTLARAQWREADRIRARMDRDEALRRAELRARAEAGAE